MLVGMGSGAMEGLAAAGIETYEQAVAARDCIVKDIAASGANSKLDDAICFLSVSRHKEALLSPGFPEPAPPVSIRDDLGFDLSVRCLALLSSLWR